jgi:MFS family permease
LPALTWEHHDDRDTRFGTRFARGGLVVALGVLVLLLVWGVVFTFTVYSEALATAFGLSALRTSTVLSITTAVFCIAGGVTGVPAVRVPLRPVVAAAVGILQVTTSYLAVVAAFGLVGTAGGTTFVVISLVPQWFDEYEGRAMGVMFTANGLGILVLPPVRVRLLDRIGIRGAFAVIGGATALALLAATPVYPRPDGRPAERPCGASCGPDFGDAGLRSPRAVGRVADGWIDPVGYVYSVGIRSRIKHLEALRTVFKRVRA